LFLQIFCLVFGDGPSWSGQEEEKTKQLAVVADVLKVQTAAGLANGVGSMLYDCGLVASGIIGGSVGGALSGAAIKAPIGGKALLTFAGGLLGSAVGSASGSASGKTPFSVAQKIAEKGGQEAHDLIMKNVALTPVADSREQYIRDNLKPATNLTAIEKQLAEQKGKNNDQEKNENPDANFQNEDNMDLADLPESVESPEKGLNVDFDSISSVIESLNDIIS
jgi:hypothetical protein